MRCCRFCDKRQLGTAILALAFACSDPARPDRTALPGEWLSLGLRDRAVRRLAIVWSQLYAGTDNGIYRASLGSRAPNGSRWDRHRGPSRRSWFSVLTPY